MALARRWRCRSALSRATLVLGALAPGAAAVLGRRLAATRCFRACSTRMSATVAGLQSRRARAPRVPARGRPGPTCGQDCTARDADFSVLGRMLGALGVMQEEFLAPWLGTWPESIDWTGAVLGTHVSGAMRSLSEALPRFESRLDSDPSLDWKLKSNLMDQYFSQMTAYYFGQDAFAIRNEAFDDILWVVLGWLETIQYIDTHTGLHYQSDSPAVSMRPGGHDTGLLRDIIANQTYHGNQWTAAFSHRARIFWDLSARGWDTELCGGGMVWNPRLLPYKNAITNELYIAGSIAMYLHFPGDANMAPFREQQGTRDPDDPSPQDLSGAKDPKYLQAAIEGYKWLANSNMTNAQGLYTDGFHISGYSDKHDNNTKCDQRSEDVLTYNQGVLLTGLRGLWDATGADSYLADGHELVQNVIRATGFDLRTREAEDDGAAALRSGRLPPWKGLGRAGILEEPCDASGSCNQDATTFKGIFLHHLAAFCAPLPAAPVYLQTSGAPGDGSDPQVLAALRESHARACHAYSAWLRWNLLAASKTRDERGRFGQWWTAGLLREHWTAGRPWPTLSDDGVPRPGAPRHHPNTDPTFWRGPYLNTTERTASSEPGPGAEQQHDRQQKPLGDRRTKHRQAGGGGTPEQQQPGPSAQSQRDPNLRGRGRSVEAHSGGLALLRAYWLLGQAP